MMKRVISVLLIFVVFLSIGLRGNADGNNIQIIIDGEVVEIKPDPIIDKSTYVELESFIKQPNFETKLTKKSVGRYNEYIIYSEKTGRETVLRESNGTIEEVVINGVIRQTKVEVKINNNMLWVPLVFLVECIGGEATWNPATRRIMIDSYSPLEFKNEKFEEEVRKVSGVLEGDIFKCDLEVIKVLDLNKKGIDNIEGIQYFTNLIHLDLSNNNITDITQLRTLDDLTTLYLKNNKISDYSALSEIYSKLSFRDFSINVKIYDQNLEKIIREKVGKYSSELLLEDLRDITSLDLNEREISNVEGIQYLFNLNELNLSNNGVKNIDPVKNLIHLKSLYLNNNEIENIKPLGYLKDLELLDLQGNKVSDITSLENLLKLKQLSFMDNKVSDISKLSGLVNLEILVMQGNEITDIKSLENLVNLKELYLKKNSIEDFAVLDKLPGLQIADVDTGYVSNNDPDKEIIQNYYIGQSYYYINAKKFKMDVAPIIQNGRTFLPVRYVAEGLGAESIKWIPEEKKIRVVYKKKVVEMILNNKVAMVDGQLKQIDEAPFIDNGRTLVPLRFLGESLGCEVNWNPKTKCVTLYNDVYVNNSKKDNIKDVE